MRREVSAPGVIYTKECFWSLLEITVFWEKNIDSVITESFSLLDSFEADYSRFIPGNILSSINKYKQHIVSKEIASLLRLCIRVSELTEGYFDITILPLLENAWYGIVEWTLEEKIWYENISLDWESLILKNDVNIEFWSCGKWYAIDLIYNSLIKHIDNFVINFWGDMRIAWKKTIHLENPLDIKKTIGSIDLENISIASSSWNRRKIWEGHHLLNPKTKSSWDHILAVYVTHKLWVFADIFSTALFVSPLQISKKVLEKVSGLEALIILSDGKIYKSGWFDSQLTI